MPLARSMPSLASDRIVFVDDGISDKALVNGQVVMSFCEFVAYPVSLKQIAIAIAAPQVRSAIAARVAEQSIPLTSIWSSQVCVMDEVEIGDGALVSSFVTFASNIRIGCCFHANLYSYVEHDCQIGDFVTFAPGVMCNGNVHIGDGAYIGSGAVLRQGTPEKPLKIGSGANVGMGAVVTKDVPPDVTVVGNPARIFEK